MSILDKLELLRGWGNRWKYSYSSSKFDDIIRILSDYDSEYPADIFETSYQIIFADKKYSLLIERNASCD